MIEIKESGTNSCKNCRLHLVDVMNRLELKTTLKTSLSAQKKKNNEFMGFVK